MFVLAFILLYQYFYFICLFIFVFVFCSLLSPSFPPKQRLIITSIHLALQTGKDKLITLIKWQEEHTQLQPSKLLCEHICVKGLY